tara:strand:+ start:206 stop:409 length:204 start_codon:yes stop_codon:yes gene_type:complete
MIAFTFIIALASLIISTGALVKALDNRKDIEQMLNKIDFNRLAIKNLNENFSRRVAEVLDETDKKLF